MIKFANNSLADHFLTKEELKSACPAAFKTEPTNPKVSDRYVQANTETVVDDLAKLGWYPVLAKQCRTNKKSSGIRSLHMIAFQNPDVKIAKIDKDGGEIVDSWPRIILTNSHDGFNSFKFLVGMFRLVCSNGLIVGDNEMVNMSIKHINYDFEALRDIVKTAIEQVPNIVCQMNSMKNTILFEDDKIELAKSVVKIRKGVEDDEKFEIDEETIMDILDPQRKEDKGDDLWTVFNICQEKMIKGEYSDIGSNNKPRKQRKITSIKKDIDFNQKLWAIATKFIPSETVA